MHADCCLCILYLTFHDYRIPTLHTLGLATFYPLIYRVTVCNCIGLADSLHALSLYYNYSLIIIVTLQYFQPIEMKILGVEKKCQKCSFTCILVPLKITLMDKIRFKFNLPVMGSKTRQPWPTI